MNKYPFNHQGHEANLHVFEDEIDLQKIFDEGFFVTRISKNLRNSILKLALGLEYTPYDMDSIDHGNAADHQFTEENIPPSVKMVVDSLLMQCSPALSLYHNDELPVEAELGIAKLSRGYFVPWHQDCNNQGVLSFCAIFNAEDFLENEGGTLQFAKVTHNEKGDIESREIKKSLPTNNNGQIVIFDPSNLNYQHQCTEILCDKTRFLFFGSIGEIE